MRRTLGLLLLASAASASASDAADLPRDRGHPVVFAPTDPVGVASAVPRSPLQDLVSGAPQRFRDWYAAQVRCGRDPVVRVTLGATYYAATRPGDVALPTSAFMCQADASIEGIRPPPGFDPSVR